MAVVSLRVDLLEDTLEVPLRTVKNGFIHFHNPADVAATKCKALRRASWPVLLDIAILEEDDADAVLERNLDGECVSKPHTPSTQCPSPCSAGPSPLLEDSCRSCAIGMAAGSSDSNPATWTARRPTRPPFASLLLPAWAVEKATQAEPVSDFWELKSWYSSSPASSLASSPPASPQAQAVAWADLVDDEHEEDYVAVLITSTPASSLASSPPASPRAQAVAWADLVDDECEEDYVAVLITEPLAPHDRQLMAVDLEELSVTATRSAPPFFVSSSPHHAGSVCTEEPAPAEDTTTRVDSGADLLNDDGVGDDFADAAAIRIENF